MWKKSEMASDRSLDFPGKLPSEIDNNYNNKKNHLFCFLHRVEDHDDLTPIFNRQSDVLTSTYGMYLKLKLNARLQTDM